jgi:hypothetical protein
MLLNFQLLSLPGNAKPVVMVRSPEQTDRMVKSFSGAHDPHPFTHRAWITFQVETLFTITLPPLCSKYRPT